MIIVMQNWGFQIIIMNLCLEMPLKCGHKFYSVSYVASIKINPIPWSTCKHEVDLWNKMVPVSQTMTIWLHMGIYISHTTAIK